VTPVRLAFYALYIVLGVVIVARMLSIGLHWELLTGIIFGLLLVVLGIYRIVQYIKGRTVQR
jgi:hypothetical protein